MTDNEVKINIKNFLNSGIMLKMKEGASYYNLQNTYIKGTSKKFYSSKDKCLKENPFSSNQKLYSGFLSLLVDQKVGYSINEKMSLKDGDIEDVEDYIEDFMELLQNMSVEASVKSRSVLQFYINVEGKLKYKQIPSEQIIPIYDADDKNKLVNVIRFYSVNSDNDTKRVVEVYDSEKVEIFEEINGKYTKINCNNTLERKILYGDKVVKSNALGWGRPPFAIMYNSQADKTDLEYIKSYVDAYDIISSDFANNICDFQDVFLIIKNYIGDSNNIGEVIDELRNTRGVAITGDDTGVDIKTVDIPVNAREVMLNLLEKNIFKFGMGVNVDNLDGNITNVRIKALYSNLDLKANKFETSVQKFWRQCKYFIDRYAEFVGEEKPDFKKLIFNRSMVMNEVEILEANATQIGVVSEKTRLANHHWVSNVNEEIESMKN